tara:strand:- start:431 stop:706 length:276 start_codon:yes stop_codon:yes gene_type:complete
MIENKFYNTDNKKDYNSEFILKIINRTLIEEKTNTEKELYVDENWRINSDDSIRIISDENSELERLLSKSFPNKNITVTDNKDGSQTILIT